MRCEQLSLKDFSGKLILEKIPPVTSSKTYLSIPKSSFTESAIQSGLKIQGESLSAETMYASLSSEIFSQDGSKIFGNILRKKIILYEEKMSPQAIVAERKRFDTTAKELNLSTEFGAWEIFEAQVDRIVTQRREDMQQCYPIQVETKNLRQMRQNPVDKDGGVDTIERAAD